VAFSDDFASGSVPIAPLFLRKIFPGILLEKSVKMTRRLMPSATPAVPYDCAQDRLYYTHHISM
jgi:hypothetical protein